MENNQENLELGGGIKAVSIIQIVLDSLGIISYLLFIAFKDQLIEIVKNAGQNTAAISSITTSRIAISLIFAAIIIISLVLILKRKAAGVFLYFASTIISIVLNIILSGFNVVSLIFSLIFPVIMAILISNKKQVFGIGKNESTNM